MNNDKNYFVKNIEAGDLLEKFIVSAVVSILSIRAILDLTGYPQLGGEGFHIAHMLWGGFFMVIALFLLLIFLNSRINTLAAILGGIGFGTFIDELGKFITNDNNYFYQPTVALIYAIFIVIYIVYKIFNKPTKITQREYTVNAIEKIKEIFLNNFDHEEKKKALEYLKKSDSENPIIKMLSEMVSRVDPIAPKSRSIVTKLTIKVSLFYSKLIKSKQFAGLVIIFFSILSFMQIVTALLETMSVRSFVGYGLVFSSLGSGAFVTFGIYFLIINNRLNSYIMFKYAVLISIFLTQYFLFFEEQVSAITRVIISIVILAVLQNLIRQEKLLSSSKVS